MAAYSMYDILSNFDDDLNVVVIGAGGGIGQAFIQHLSQSKKVKFLHAFSRQKPDLPDRVVWNGIDIMDEESVKAAAGMIEEKIDIVLVAIGMLYDDKTQPEKSVRDINIENFEKIFAVNTIAPALMIKYFCPLLTRERRSVFSALSARVGSISDNQIGGWYAYRASKAALNMLLKNASIEIGRRNKGASIIGLHPGTVDTHLSEPFQGNVPEGKLFTAEYSTQKMLEVINTSQSDKTGRIFDYAGKEVLP